MPGNVVGVDIGTSALRAVEVRHPDKARPTVLRCCEVPLPDGAVDRGEVRQPDVVAAALKQLWSQGGFKSRAVVLGMGNQRVLVRDLTVPAAPLKAIRESLPFQVQDTLPLPVSDAQLDFYPASAGTGEEASTVDGLLVAAGKQAVLGNIEAVRGAGLRTVEVDLIPFALSRVLLPRTESEGVVAVIDVGASTTSVLIARDGIPQFVRLIPAGGRDLTSALAMRLEIGTEHAEHLKRSLGLGLQKEVPEQHHEALKIIYELTSELLSSVRNTVNYFLNTRPQDPVRRLILTGGGAKLPGFTEAIAEMTRLEVVMGDPFAAVGLPPRFKDADHWRGHPAMAVALGLAIGDRSAGTVGEAPATKPWRSAGAVGKTAPVTGDQVTKPGRGKPAPGRKPKPQPKPHPVTKSQPSPDAKSSLAFRRRQGHLLVIGGERKVDLLPTEVRQVVRARRTRDRLGMAVLTVLVLTLLGSVAAYLAELQAQGRLTAEQAQTGLLQAEQAKYSEVRRIQNEVALIEEARRIGTSVEIDWKSYLDNVQQTLPAHVAIKTVDIDSSSPLTAYDQPTAPLQGERVATLVFAATSPTLPEVPIWLDGLQALPGFADALPGSVITNDDGTYTVNVTMHINEEAFSKRFDAEEKQQ